MKSIATNYSFTVPNIRQKEHMLIEPKFRIITLDHFRKKIYFIIEELVDDTDVQFGLIKIISHFTNKRKKVILLIIWPALNESINLHQFPTNRKEVLQMQQCSFHAK